VQVPLARMPERAEAHQAGTQVQESVGQLRQGQLVVEAAPHQGVQRRHGLAVNLKWEWRGACQTAAEQGCISRRGLASQERPRCGWRMAPLLGWSQRRTRSPFSNWAHQPQAGGSHASGCLAHSRGMQPASHPAAMLLSWMGADLGFLLNCSHEGDPLPVSSAWHGR
jgi:hypothetical protein